MWMAQVLLFLSLQLNLFITMIAAEDGGKKLISQDPQPINIRVNVEMIILRTVIAKSRRFVRCFYILFC